MISAPAGPPLSGTLRCRLRWQFTVLVIAAVLTGGPMARPAGAQWLPSTPVTLFGGRVVLSGSLSVSFGTADDLAYYNLSDYETDILRVARAGLTAGWRLSSQAELVADGYAQTSMDRWDLHFYPAAIYLRVRPLPSRSVSLSAGIVPPAFGTFLRRRYGADNPLIGAPLSYHYATLVRPDAFPASADELLWKRGFGAAVRYSLGNRERDTGLPLANGFGWNPGIELSAGTSPWRLSVALTKGGVANRWQEHEPGGWGVSGRLERQVGPGLHLGVSAAHSSYLHAGARNLAATAASNASPRDTLLGADAEYSAGYWLVRGEVIVSRRTVPAFAAPRLDDPLRVVGTDVEVRYKVAPGLYVAARASHLGFSQVRGTTTEDTWDANVTRYEAGGGYSLTRNLILKASYQYNRRDASWFSTRHLVAGQVVAWF